MRIILIFSILVFASCGYNKNKAKPEEKLEVKLNKDTIQTLANKKTDTSFNNMKTFFALSNQAYNSEFSLLDIPIFEKGSVIKIIDTLGIYEVGLFNGNWLKGVFEEHEFLIPSFCVIETGALKIPKLQLIDIVQENERIISYHDEVNDTFSSQEEIVFSTIDDIEVVYFLIKAIYERENNKFPLNIKTQGKVDDYLEVHFVEIGQSLEVLELKWLFEGGDLIITFKKIVNGGVIVNIKESFG